MTGTWLHKKSMSKCPPPSPTSVPAPIAQLVECPLRGTGGHGFNPVLRHTKVVKNGTSCSSLGTQIYGVELGYDTSVRQHYKSEH